jgi:hypothetical protein
MLLFSFLALLPRSVLGFLAVHWMWKSVDGKDLLIKVFLALPLGLGISSLLGFLWIWAGFDLELYVALETIGTVALLVFTAWKQKAFLTELRRRPLPAINRQALLWLGIAGLALLLYALESWAYSTQYPHGGWDAWNHWNVVSRFIYRGGEHWTGTFLRTGDHPDYPLFVPITNAITWVLLQRETIRGPLVLAFFSSLTVAGLVFSLIYKLRDLPQAALGTVVLLAHSLFAIWTVAQYADTSLALFFLASAGLIPLYFHTREPSLPMLAGFMTGLGAWTKNEGLVFVVINAMAWILLVRIERTAFKNFLLGMLFPLVIVFLFKINLAPANDIFSGGQDFMQLILDPERYRTIARIGALTFRNMDGTPVMILLGLLIYGLFAGKTRKSISGVVPVILIAAAQLAAYFVIYLITPLDVVYHVRGSIGRLYLHVLPLLLLGVFLWLRSPTELTGTDEK